MVRGHQWAWEVQEGDRWDFKQEGGPARIEVDQGEVVVLHLLSVDVAHGFSLPAYDLEAQLDHVYPVELNFTADKAGRFTFRCFLNCGNQHPYMVGVVVVKPNNLLPAGLLGVVVLGMAGAAWGLRKGPSAGVEAPEGGGRDLLAGGVGSRLRRLLADRRPQFAVQALLVGGLAFSVFAGLTGQQNGAHNLAVVGVWLVWWFLLVAVAVPLTGRAWCGICPLPLPGEWLARRRLLGPPAEEPQRDPRPGWPWRKWGLAPALGLLLGMGATSMVLTTSPGVTGLALLGLVGLATVVTARYRGRAFCNHLCPVAPFLRLYSRMSPLVLEAGQGHTCSSHKTKGCLRGAAGAWGCPWERYPAAPDSQAGCGFCLECLRSCTKENVTLKLRGPHAGLARTRLRTDEAYGAALLVGLVVVYQLVMLGPYPGLKGGAGYTEGFLAYLLYLGLLAVLALGLPLLLVGTVKLAARLSRAAPPTLLRTGAVALLPLGLATWVAFKLPVVLTNWVYLPRVASDPFGWGWNLWGTAHYGGGVLLVEGIVYLQVALVLAGLVWSARLVTARLGLAGLAGRKLSGAATPLLGLVGGLAALFIVLFGG